MAGVFGNPITTETLEGLPEYDGKTIGAIDRAGVAMKWINAESKDTKALQYVTELRKNCNSGCGVLCLIYNATGGSIEYYSRYDWSGFLGADPYPMLIQNGQWGVFLHRADNDCISAVVYRGSDTQKKGCDWCVSWKVHRENPYQNRVYTEVRESGHYSSDSTWNVVHEKLETHGVQHKDYDYGDCLSIASIGNDTYSTCKAILTLKNSY